MPHFAVSFTFLIVITGGLFAPHFTMAQSPDEKNQRAYSGYENPTGLQIGMVDPDSAADLPDEVKVMAERGALASAEGKWEDALSAYEDMVRAAPRNSLAYANLGIVEYRMGRYEDAKNDLLSSLALNPTLAQNWMTLGLCYFQLGELNLAMASLARAKHVEISPTRISILRSTISVKRLR